MMSVSCTNKKYIVLRSIKSKERCLLSISEETTRQANYHDIMIREFVQQSGIPSHVQVELWWLLCSSTAKYLTKHNKESQCSLHPSWRVGILLYHPKPQKHERPESSLYGPFCRAKHHISNNIAFFPSTTPFLNLANQNPLCYNSIIGSIIIAQYKTPTPKNLPCVRKRDTHHTRGKGRNVTSAVNRNNTSSTNGFRRFSKKTILVHTTVLYDLVSIKAIQSIAGLTVKSL